MSKVSTNISLDAELKAESVALFKDLGLDLTTAVTIFLKQAIRVQGMPFAIIREVPNQETYSALAEYEEMQQHPERYKRYASFKEAMDEVLSNV